SGWTDREIAEKRFSDLFVPLAEKHRVNPEKPIVLTYDGHDSHETDIMKRAPICKCTLHTWSTSII
ncbi:hypothetical protein DFJ58DRAFT_660321, partial [Suillus subalutaceus]|uniref:uncharacterized protein n=1 Tax=Suillus subalutaceus TaxID=48586 RepID=UPI001B874AFA